MGQGCIFPRPRTRMPTERAFRDWGLGLDTKTKCSKLAPSILLAEQFVSRGWKFHTYEKCRCVCAPCTVTRLSTRGRRVHHATLDIDGQRNIIYIYLSSMKTFSVASSKDCTLTRTVVMELGSRLVPSSWRILYPSALLSRSDTFHNFIVLSGNRKLYVRTQRLHGQEKREKRGNQGHCLPIEDS